MPRGADDLFESIASFGALHEAALEAVKGKRRKPGAAAFMANLEKELLRLERELNDGSYRPGSYTTFTVKDPKERFISAAPFRDRVVHHALCAVVVPLFERGFIDDSYANRVGKGSHRAVARYERFRDRFRHVLRCDMFRYFPSIDHEILKADLRRRIACPRTLALLDAIVDASNPQEPVHRYFPGDDLFTPFERRRGLPIGNLTSQFFANLYLDPLDHFVKEMLRAKGYVRYVDDFALFHDEPTVLKRWRERISEFLARRRLLLHPRKTHVATTSDPARVLGFVLHSGGRRRLPEENIRRFGNRLRGLRDRWRAGTVGRGEVVQRINSWVAHASHADTGGLRHAIFRGGWFDPQWSEVNAPPAFASAARKPGRPPAPGA
jgi:retron-type reverse transcriptase